MLSALGSWLRGAQRASSPPIQQRLATAVLLVELARADLQRDPGELELIRRTLAEAFSLSAAEAEALMAEAVAHARDAVSLHDYIAVLNQQMPVDERERLIGWLWEVAHADGRVDRHEEALIRQLADWLHVRQAFVRQRLRVEGA